MASHKYNTKNYNESHYNNDSTSYVLLFTETIATLDVLSKSISVALVESVSSSDVRTDVFDRRFVESILHLDTLTKQITNKLLSDRIRLNDWLEMKINSDQWGD